MAQLTRQRKRGFAPAKRATHTGSPFGSSNSSGGGYFTKRRVMAGAFASATVRV